MHSLPKKIEAIARHHVVAVSAGASHNLAVTADGAVWSWGFGNHGHLGYDGTQDQLLPKKVEALAHRVVAVSAGTYHNLVLTADGTAWSWGSGGNGRLGHGGRQRRLLPKKVEAFAGQRVVAVSAGYDHSLAITADGAVWSWGEGGYGQLGHGDEQDEHLPKKIEALAGQRVIAASGGTKHSLALTADGAVWSFGDGGHGKLGHGNEQRQLMPKKIEGLLQVVVVSVQAHHAVAIAADGAVFAWGKGEHGCLGHGEDPSNQLRPKKIEA